MNKREIASLAFKIAGIYALIIAIQMVQLITFYIREIISPTNPGSTGQPWGSPDWIATLFLIISLIPLLLLITIACILIIRSTKFAIRMFPEAEHEPTETRYLGIQALAYSVVGLFLIASSIPQLFAIIAQIITYSSFGGTPAWLPVISQLVGTCLKLILGLLLFFGCHGVARFWSKLRYAGIRREMGICEKCGYDLTGNTSGVCPECGEKISEPTETNQGNP
ncbi:MAG: hypothetical protein ACYTF1_02885 [Planctomycetota bacterium]|jgi:hypothetical protein